MRRTRNANNVFFFVTSYKNRYLKSLFSTYVVRVFTKLTFEKSHQQEHFDASRKKRNTDRYLKYSLSICFVRRRTNNLT